jgi:pilus assembly protein Flp/PilA
MNLKKLNRVAARFCREEDGPTATEYAVMLALIIVVTLAMITTLGTKTEALFPDLASVIS